MLGRGGGESSGPVLPRGVLTNPYNAPGKATFGTTKRCQTMAWYSQARSLLSRCHVHLSWHAHFHCAWQPPGNKSNRPSNDTEASKFNSSQPKARRTKRPPFTCSCVTIWELYQMLPSGVSLTGKKKCSGTSFPKKGCGHSMCSTMVGGSWRLAVGGGWRLAVGNWRLVAVSGGWRRLVAGGWWLEAVGSGWQLAVGRRWRLVAVGGWRLVVGGWWRLAVDGSWRLAVGGPLGRPLRAVLSKKKKISSLKDPPGCRGI